MQERELLVIAIWGFRSLLRRGFKDFLVSSNANVLDDN